MKALLILITLAIPTIAFAAPGEGVPVATVISQVVNLSAAIGILIYFLRKPVREFFAAKKDDFEAEVIKAKVEKEEAEKLRAEIAAKVEKLKTGTQADLETARKEAAAVKEKMIADATATAKKIEEDALNKAHYEMQRTVTELREELLHRSLDMAKEKLQTQTPSDDLSRLKIESIEKIQVVQ